MSVRGVTRSMRTRPSSVGPPIGYRLEARPPVLDRGLVRGARPGPATGRGGTFVRAGGLRDQDGAGTDAGRLRDGPGCSCGAVRHRPPARMIDGMDGGNARPRGVEIHPFPSSRRLVTAEVRAGRRVVPMHGLLDVDVTGARRRLPAHEPP